jgi:glycerophosphoryl diester phosphodiesterase
LRTHGRPLVLAHRGASAAFPENTAAAFEAAGRLGADGVELDVRLTADGQLAVHHDERYGDGRPVCEVAAADRPEGVLLLAEALAACGPLLVNVELKNAPIDVDFDPDSGIADVAAAALDGYVETVLASCFYLPTLDRLGAVAPNLRRAWLLSVVSDATDAVATAADHGCVAIHPHETALDAAFVALAHDAGLAVNTWTVDEPARLLELAAWGVDGIVTNVPDVAVAVLGQGSTSRRTSGSWRNSSDSTSPR